MYNEQVETTKNEKYINDKTKEKREHTRMELGLPMAQRLTL